MNLLKRNVLTEKYTPSDWFRSILNRVDELPQHPYYRTQSAGNIPGAEVSMLYNRYRNDPTVSKILKRNALFIILAAKVVPGFSVAGFWTAFWFSIVLSLINAFFHLLLSKLF